MVLSQCGIFFCGSILINCNRIDLNESVFFGLQQIQQMKHTVCTYVSHLQNIYIENIGKWSAL